MLRKEIALLLTFVMTQLAFAPPTALAQTPSQHRSGDGERTLGVGQAEQRPGLKAAIAEAMARSKTATLPGHDINRIEKKWQEPAPVASKQPKSSKKTKIILVVAGFVALGVVLALTLPDDAPPICETVPTDPLC